jgi:signal transduction histidine kinase
MIALFTAAVHLRLPAVLLLVLLSAVSALAQFSLGQAAGRTGYWLAVGLAVLISLLVVGWGIAVRSRRELVLLMAERLHRLEAEQEIRLREARQAVRDGIARDMHDSLAHRLSLISMSAGALQYRDSLPDEDYREMAAIVMSNAQHSLGELREVVSVLRRPDGLAVPGQHGPDGIGDLVSEARSAGQSVDARWAVPHEMLSPTVNDAVYRLVQEGLSNARKHAPGARVTLRGELDAASGLAVEMVNSVERPHPMRPEGSGLAGAAERIDRTGGILISEATVGRFRLRANWPAATIATPTPFLAEGLPGVGGST